MKKGIPANKIFFSLTRSTAIILLLLSSIFVQAQITKKVNWTRLAANKSANFYQVQKDFKQYWQGKKIEKGKGYKVFKRWEAFMEPRVYPSGDMTLPSTTYAKFMEWKQGKAKRPVGPSAAASTANWTELGPIGSPSGPSPYSGTGAGRLNFVRFMPGNSSVMYVGAPDGGLWKSTNSGGSWTTNTDFLPIIGCADLAIDPGNTSTMYLATGDVESNRNSIGILKSTNGGATWNATGLTFTASESYTISKLLMHPTNPLIMIAATNGGIFRTDDGWVTSTQPQCCDNFKDMEFKPGDPNTIYAAGTTFWKSTDNGVNWAQVTTGLPSSNVSRIALGVTSGNSAYVYALIGRSSDQGFLGMYRSTNSGTSFSLRSSTPNLLGYQTDGLDVGGQAFYDLAVVVSNANPEIVTTGGVNHWQSTNGGTTWTNLSFWASGEVHADIHELSYLPGSSTTMFSCNDGGIFKSTNNGDDFTDISNNLAIQQMTEIGLSTSNPTLIVEGSQDNGTNLLNGASWSSIFGGDGGDCFINRTNNDTIFFSYVNAEFHRSDDGGATENLKTSGLTGGADFYSRWYQDPVNTNILYAGGRNFLFKSTNKGDSWMQTDNGFGSGSIKAIAVAPSNNSIVYSIQIDAVSKSINGGVNINQNKTGTLPVGSAHLSDIVVSNTNPNKVWVCFSGYDATDKVFRSIDGGNTWTNISAGLPNLPMNTLVAVDNSADDAIYVGGDIGVYYYDNALASWEPFFTDLPNAHVSDLEIHYATGKIRAGTYGRGAWQSDVYVPPAANHTITATAGANGSISPGGVVNVATGSSKTFTITPNACYKIATVEVDNVNNPGAVSSGSYTFTNITVDHTIEATFSLLTYTITSSAGANGSISPNGAGSVNCGANKTYTITADGGFIVQDVLVDGISVGALSTYTFNNVTATHTIAASFVAVDNSHMITSSAGANGSISPLGSVSVASGANQAYTITPNACYRIATVLVDGVNNAAAVSSGAYTFSNVTVDHTISATFSILTYTITASAGANGSISPNGASQVNCGANKTYTISPNPGFVVLNVLVDGNSLGSITNYTFSNVTAPHTISASFGNAPPVSVVLEAELAVLSNAVVNTFHPGFTGTGYADYTNNSGDYIEWTINKTGNVSTSLSFRYANGSSGNRPLRLQVNGVVVVASLAFNPTGGWTNWSTKQINVNLTAGANKIRLTTIGSNGANIDHLAMADAVIASGGILEAELALLSNAFVNTFHPGFTGTGYADYTNNTGDYVEWTLNRSGNVSTSLNFRYANGSSNNRPLRLQVNGVVVAANLAFNPTGAWTTWSTKQITVNLTSGANKIRLTTIGSNGANIDHLAYSDVAPVSSPVSDYATEKNGDLKPSDPILGDMIVTASPNPSPGNFNLLVNSSNKKSRISLIVTDVLGRIIEKKSNLMLGNKNQIGSSYRKGFYFVKIIQGDNYRVVKLIKE